MYVQKLDRNLPEESYVSLSLHNKSLDLYYENLLFAFHVSSNLQNYQLVRKKTKTSLSQ